ncbi:MAG: hypothetical protein V7647_937 [Acidobacteriota bacterium]|jgi:uncharacterized damage-inducible protein DinB
MFGPGYLEQNFRTVRKNTVLVAEDIPADKYTFTAAPGVKSVGQMLAHIAVSPRWQMALHREGVTAVDFPLFAARVAQVQAEEQALQSKDHILAALKEGGEEFAAFLAGLSAPTLAETISFPPPIQPAVKTRMEMLMSVKEHEMHHRAQLMLMQRMLGIVPHLTRQREASVRARA